MIVRILLISCLSILCPMALLAQREPSIPIGALPTLYNGGFAGEAGALRVASYNFFEHGKFAYGPPWITSSRISGGSFVSVDNFIKKLRSGVAVTAGCHGVRDHYSYTSLSLVISPKFSFREKYTFAPFADLTYGRLRLSEHSQFFPPGDKTDDIKLNTGFLVNSKKAYLGLSVDVLRYYYVTTQLQAFTEMTYFFQTGYSFQRTSESRFSFTPQLLLSFRQYTIDNINTGDSRRFTDIRLIDLNLVFRYKQVIAGINYNGIMVGYQNSRFKLQVTNYYYNDSRPVNGIDISTNTSFTTRDSPIGRDTYSGNISVRYIFKSDTPAKAQSF